MLVAILATMGLFTLPAASTAAQDATGTPATPAVTPAPDAPRLELEFEELNDSGVSGTATLYESGDQTIVELSLEDTGENHPAHIHAGSCDDLQPEPEYPLQNVGAEGQSTSVVDATLADLIAGDFAIDLHLSPNELGTLIVCANIEGEPVAPTAEGTPGGAPGTPPTVAATQPAAATQAATQPPQPTATQPSPPTATQPPVPIAPPTQAATPTVQTPQPLVAVAIRVVDAAVEAATLARAAVAPQGTAGDQTRDVTEPAVTDTPDEAEATAAPANAPDGTGGAVNDSEGAASAPLPSTGDPDVDGTVVLTMIDADTTRISVMLSGDAVTSDAIVHLHDGTCDTPGDFTLELNPPDAEGTSETDVDLSLDELLGDGYFINVHESEAAYDTLLVCGELADATVGMVMPENPAPEAGATIVITPDPATTPTAAPADTLPVVEPTSTPVEQTPAAEPTAAPDTLTPAAEVTTTPADQTPVVEPTAAPDTLTPAVEETPAAEATTAPENETPVAGKTIVTTPEPTEAPAPAQGDVIGDGTSGDVAASGKGSPIQPAGDGTSGDVSDAGSASASASGKGSPVDPTTGLPRTTGTGPIPMSHATGIDRAAWLSGALALLALGAGIRVRRVETRRSRSVVRTTTSRLPSRWTLPDI